MQRFFAFAIAGVLSLAIFVGMFTVFAPVAAAHSATPESACAIQQRRLELADMIEAEVWSSWQNCSADGHLCYFCSNDSGTCICNWFYDGKWQATTDCGSAGQ